MCHQSHRPERADVPLCRHCGTPAYCSASCARAAAADPQRTRAHHRWLCALVAARTKRSRSDAMDVDGGDGDGDGDPARPTRRARTGPGPTPPPTTTESSSEADSGSRKRAAPLPTDGSSDESAPKRVRTRESAADRAPVASDWLDVTSPVWQSLPTPVRVYRIGRQWPAEAAALYYRHERAVRRMLDVPQNRRLLLYVSEQIPRVLRSYLRWRGLTMRDLVRDWRAPVTEGRPNEWMPLYQLLTTLWPTAGPHVGTLAVRSIEARAGPNPLLVRILRAVNLVPPRPGVPGAGGVPSFVLQVARRDWWPPSRGLAVLETASDEGLRATWRHVLYLSPHVYGPLQAFLQYANLDLADLLADYQNEKIRTTMHWFNLFRIVANHLRPARERASGTGGDPIEQTSRYILLPVRQYLLQAAGPESRLVQALAAVGLMPDPAPWWVDTQQQQGNVKRSIQEPR